MTVLSRISTGSIKEGYDRINTTAVQDALNSGVTKAKVGANLVNGTRAIGDKPVTKFDKLQKRSSFAEKALQASIAKSMSNPQSVINGLSPQFQGALNLVSQMSPTAAINQMLTAALGKSFTTTSPLTSGLVPFDLVAPSLLIYPVYSPFRNRFPRVPGQGAYHRGKIITSIMGSQPGIMANPGQRVSISELPNGGSLANWPAQIPGSGSQNAVDVIVPYRFFGLTEAATWLAQIAGQGFDDIAGLASLVLLQEFMLAEERSILGATAFTLAAPGQAVGTARAAQSNETALSGVTTNIYVRLTTVNYYGETVSSAVSSAIAVAAGQVVDVTIPRSQAGLQTNIYVGTGAADPGVAGSHIMAQNVGGTTYTLMGAIPTTGNTAPTVDTGTASTTDYEGMVSILSGHAAANAGSGYPADYAAGYYNNSVGTSLSIAAVNEALLAVWDSATGYLADPPEMWCEGSDAVNLSTDLLLNANGQNYTLFIQQDEVANATAGVAVSQMTNPVTRSTMKITVHPYMPQGTAAGLSYQLPQSQTNLPNVWENVMVQDYLSINWPVIDPTFRYSIFMYGTLWCPAPQYNFLLQGLQKSDTKPYS